jgi:hypothetical protein
VFQGKRGHEASGNKGGRPKKTKTPPGMVLGRRLKLKPLARRLHRAGLSLNQIVARPEFAKAEPKPVGRSTIQRWVS